MALAVTARSFTVLYNLVAKRCQDTSADGLQNAKDGINDVIKELTREFTKLPSQFIGTDKSQFVSPSSAIGIQTSTLASNITKIENVFWISNNSEQYILEQITDDQEWLKRTDQNSTGDPLVYRVIFPDSSGNNTLQTWPGASSGWQSYSGGKLYYTYWAQLSQLVNDGDIPALPYELDTILVSGGIYYAALTQGDTTLMSLWRGQYEDDKGEMRAWILNQRRQDGQQRPDAPMGVYGRDRQVSGYKTQG